MLAAPGQWRNHAPGFKVQSSVELDAMRRIVLAAALILAWPIAAIAAPIVTISDAFNRIGEVNLRTGAVSNVRSYNYILSDIAYDAKGRLYGLSFEQLFAIKGSKLRAIGEHGMAGDANGLTFGRNGALYGSSDRLYKINPKTGKATAVGGIGYKSSGDLDFVEGKLYLSSSLPTADTLFRVDTTSGAGEEVGGFGISGMYGLTAVGDKLYGFAGTSIFLIDRLTEAAREIADYGGQGLDVAYGAAYSGKLAPVPVPAALPFIGAALLWLGLLRRRRGTAWRLLG